MHGFVGRRTELTALRARLAAAGAGDPQVVQIQGSAGIGKTALLTRFLADPGDGVHPVVLRASGEETEVLVPYGVVDQIARSAGPTGSDLLLPVGYAGAGVDDAVAVGSRLLELPRALQAEAPGLLLGGDAPWVGLASPKGPGFALRR